MGINSSEIIETSVILRQCCLNKVFNRKSGSELLDNASSNQTSGISDSKPISMSILVALTHDGEKPRAEYVDSVIKFDGSQILINLWTPIKTFIKQLYFDIPLRLEGNESVEFIDHLQNFHKIDEDTIARYRQANSIKCRTNIKLEMNCCYAEIVDINVFESCRPFICDLTEERAELKIVEPYYYTVTVKEVKVYEFIKIFQEDKSIEDGMENHGSLDQHYILKSEFNNSPFSI